jgi:hypothetical protein
LVIMLLRLRPSKALANKPGQYGSTLTSAAFKIVWIFSAYSLIKIKVTNMCRTPIQNSSVTSTILTCSGTRIINSVKKYIYRDGYIIVQKNESSVDTSQFVSALISHFDEVSERMLTDKCKSPQGRP